MGLYSTPQAPDPEKTAQAQFNYDLGSSAASGIINNPNVVNPYGSTNYTQAGTETITLPDGKTIQVPRYTQTTTLNQRGQDIDNTLNRNFWRANQAYLQNRPWESSATGAVPWATGYNVGQLGSDFSGDTGSIAFTGDPTQRGSAGTQDMSGLISGFDLTQNPNTQRFDRDFTGNIRTGYGPEDFSSDRVRVENAVFGRGNELLEQSRDADNARLAAMGLTPGGAAYGRVADQQGRNANDLAMQAVLAGGTEQSRQLGEARARAGFANEAIGQRFAQSTGRTALENQRRLAEAGFGNQAQLQELAARSGLISAENQRRFAETGLFNEAGQSEFAMQTALTQMENARRTGDMQAYNQALQMYNNAQIGQTQLDRDAANFQNTVRSGQIGEREALKGADLNRMLTLLQGGQVQQPQIPGFNPQGVAAPDYSGLVNNQYQQQVASQNAKLGGLASILGAGLGMFSF